MQNLESSEKTKIKLSGKPRKSRFKKRWWLLIDLALAVLIIALLLHRPGWYKPASAISGSQISPYLTHELLPQLYNGVQRREPFDLVISQNGINDAVARLNWPMESGDVRFSTPTVFFVPGGIMLMGAAFVKGVELIVMIVVEPAIDEKGLLNLRITKMKIGAMSITPLAKMMAARMYSQRLAAVGVDAESPGAKIAASIFNNEPFEPVFKIDDKKVRVEKITIESGKLTARLVPASNAK